MFAVQVICHLWDIEDEGLENFLDRAQGDLGASGVTIPVACGPICSLRRRPTAGPRVFRSRGGLYFQPDDSHYANTRIKPITSQWLKSRNPLAKAAHECHSRGIDLRAAVDTRRLGRLASRHPEAAVKSPFGDPSPDLLCPLNPDAAELFGAIAADLARGYGVSALEVRDLDEPFAENLANCAGADSITTATRSLLSLCCCESCLQSAAAAGVDTESAVRSVQVMIGSAIESAGSGPTCLEELLADDDIVAAFVEHQRSAHADMIGSLRRRVPCEMAMHVSAETVDAITPRPAWLECANVLVIRADQREGVHESAGPSSQAAHLTSTHPRCEALVPLSRSSTDSTWLVKFLTGLADGGWAGAQLDHYGMMTNADLTSAKQAIRFARRSSV